MGRNYEIEIVGAEHTERSLLSDEKKVLAALFVASEEVERLLAFHLTRAAPRPRSRTESKGGAIFTDVKRRRLFAGTQRDNMLEVIAGLRDPSVAAFVEWGTGIYASPDRGGPHAPYQVTTRRHRGLGPLLDRSGDGEFWRKTVTIPGTKPKPWFEAAVDPLRPRIDLIYRRRVHEAVN